MKMFKNNKKTINQKGFTLIEVVVSLFIFSAIISASTVIFSSIFNSYDKARDINNSLGNAQYAMNLVAKTLRTSSVLSSDGSSNSIKVFDYSQPRCVQYEFVDDSLKMKTSNTALTLADCNSSPGFGAAVDVTSGKVSGNFKFISSKHAIDGSSEVVGKVTILINITNGTSSNIKLQSTSSLRDYGKSGIGMNLN